MHGRVDEYFAAADGAVDTYTAFAKGNIAAAEKLVAVCEDTGRVVGYVYAEIKEAPPMYRVRRYAEVVEIAVEAGRRREGIGAMLLAYACDWARGRRE